MKAGTISYTRVSRKDMHHVDKVSACTSLILFTQSSERDAARQPSGLQVCLGSYSPKSCNFPKTYFTSILPSQYLSSPLIPAILLHCFGCGRTTQFWHILMPPVVPLNVQWRITSRFMEPVSICQAFEELLDCQCPDTIHHWSLSWTKN